MRDPDISFDLDFLSGQWNIIEILDESEPQYDSTHCSQNIQAT